MADTDKRCHCFIHHPQTPEEREAVTKNLHYFRRIGDSVGMLMALAQLTGKCPARQQTEAAP